MVSAEQGLVDRRARGEIQVWEQLVAFLGAALVAAALGFIAWEVVTTRDSPPALRVRAGPAQPAGDGFRVGFEVVNEGNQTATSLEVVGQLLDRGGGAVVEESRAAVDYVPPWSSRGGGLFFTRDPGAFELLLRPGGYADP